MLTINNTIDGAIQDIEIKGNTVQDPDNLADIKSVGVLQEDGTYKMSILSCGKNLFDGNKFTPREAINQYSYIDGILTMSCDGQAYRRVDYILPNTLVHGKRYILTANVKALEYSSGYTPGQNFGYGYYNGGSADYYGYFDASSNTTKLEFVYNEQGENVIGFHNEVKEGLIKLQWSNIQLEEGTVATTYEPYQGNKCDILLPCQLEKVGDVSDRLYYDDVEKAWCIEKKAKPKVEENVIVNKQDKIEKIVLPLDVQIQLNSFFGTTHVYMESGEVEGTIKCKIPKSLGATVQSLNNKTDILSDRIEAIEGLKDSQNMKYETDKGYLVCKETKNGVIDDMKIKGKTLVNLCPKYVKGSNLWWNTTFESDSDGFVTVNANGTWVACPRLRMSSVNNLKPSTKYTLVIEIKSNTLVGTDSYCMNFSSAIGVEYAFKNYVDIPIGSVGTFVYTVNTLDSFENVNYLFRSQLYNTCTEGSIIYRWYLLEGDHTQNPPSYFEGLMSVGQDVDKIEVLSSNNLLEEDEDYKQDKKQILFYNENGELEPIQELHEWDSIEKHSDNKWYYHKRSGKVVLNGSENWNNDTNSSTISPATYRQSIRFDAINMPNSAFNTQTLPNIISNSLPTVIFGDVYSYNHIGISISGTDSIGTHIIINNNFMDVTELKQWLQANNVTVVYQLAQEEVYELAPLHLDSYANETLILCNSGAISPKMEFSITSHINELVKAYGERINLLEEKVYKYMVTQNRMQLASTYSADSVTFKVDYFSLCGDEENYDEYLYNLILNNILVGEDNYNYDKMFTMILDYASWNQISWEQFDILVGLMDIQHNPPVEDEVIEEIPNEIM